MEVEVRGVTNDARHVVHIIIPPLAKLTDEQARAALERSLA